MRSDPLRKAASLQPSASSFGNVHFCPPARVFKTINPSCKATVGLVAAGGRGEKPFTKAGKKFYAYQSKAKRYFKVKGIAMNAVNHPHGGGGHPHVGKPSTVGRNAPPGRKVGRLSPQKKRRD